VLFCGIFNYGWWVYIAMSHYFIDLIKVNANPYFRINAIPFFIDRQLHIVVFIAVALISDLFRYTIGF